MFEPFGCAAVRGIEIDLPFPGFFQSIVCFGEMLPSRHSLLRVRAGIQVNCAQYLSRDVKDPRGRVPLIGAGLASVR